MAERARVGRARAGTAAMEAVMARVVTGRAGVATAREGRARVVGEKARAGKAVATGTAAWRRGRAS